MNQNESSEIFPTLTTVSRETSQVCCCTRIFKPSPIEACLRKSYSTFIIMRYMLILFIAKFTCGRCVSFTKLSRFLVQRDSHSVPPFFQERHQTSLVTIICVRHLDSLALGSVCEELGSEESSSVQSGSFLHDPILISSVFLHSLALSELRCLNL